MTKFHPRHRVGASALILAPIFALSLTSCGESTTDSAAAPSDPTVKANVAASDRTAPPRPAPTAPSYNVDALLAKLSGDDLEEGREHLADAAEERADAEKNRERAEKERARAQKSRERAAQYAKRGDADRAAEEEDRARKAEERALKDLARADQNEDRAREEERRLVRLVARSTDDQALLAQLREEDIRAGRFPIDAFGVERATIAYRLEGLIQGTQTLYIDDWGGTVGMITDAVELAGPRKQHYLWTDGRGYARDLVTGKTWTAALRAKDSEPTAFAITEPDDLERTGYEHRGEKTIAGKICEHWVNDRFHYDGCRWKRIELDFANGVLIEPGAGLKRTATQIIEGTPIPAELLALKDDIE